MLVKKVYNINKSDGSGDVLRTIVNALKQPMATSKYDDFNEWKGAQDNADEYIFELTQQEYDNYLIPANLWLDADRGQGIPLWQHNTSLSEVGSYEDPSDDGSTWFVNESIPDTRFRLTIRHDATLAAPNAGSPFLDVIKVDQFTKTVGGEDNLIKLRFEVRNKNGNLLGSGVDGRYEFYNAGTPTAINLASGIGELFISTEKAHGKKSFNSNHQYRVDNAKRSIDIMVFSKQIND